MPIREKQFPMRFTPRGLVDAFDSTDKFAGACLKLTNLIFDPSNPEIITSRPGVPSIADFAASGFANPGFISVHVTVGDVVYGMIATTRNAGKDEPFAFDHGVSSFIAVANVTNANTPTSQSSSGPWTPPTMSQVGVNLIVTHPGFPGGGTMFGWFDLTNPAAPVWNGGDTATNGLPSVPNAVSNFNNRAYFACGNKSVYTDVLSLTRTASTQALTIGDSSNITAFSGLPIQTTSSGISQALLAFKESQIWQVTGDPATNNLALNYLSLSVGTLSPRSLAPSPFGVYFASTTAPYIVDLFGVVRPVTYASDNTEPDIYTPWQNISEPTRVAACYSADVYRICMPTVVLGVAQTNDYWFHEKRRRWTGPHSFIYDCASQHQEHFILSSASIPAFLFHSFSFITQAATYLDNGAAVMTTLQTSTFPKTGDMEMNQVVESTIELASAGSVATYSITALDDLFNTLNNCSVSIQTSGSLWGSVVWGGFTWGSSTNIPTTYTVPWSAPLVFKKMALLIQATAQAALALGTFFARYKKCGYTLNR